MTKDLQSSDILIQSLALTFVSNLADDEMCRLVSQEIVRLFDTSNAQVLKRVAMAASRIIDRCPDVAESFIPKFSNLMRNGMHSVVIAGLHLMRKMCALNFSNKFQKYHTSLIPVLK
jgi:AP-1 complex subunit gamma-1